MRKKRHQPEEIVAKPRQVDRSVGPTTCIIRDLSPHASTPRRGAERRGLRRIDPSPPSVTPRAFFANDRDPRQRRTSLRPKLSD